jgi:hypothetical protein
MLSSLPLQIVIFFDTVYAFLWTIAMLVLFAWKGALPRCPAVEAMLTSACKPRRCRAWRGDQARGRRRNEPLQSRAPHS